MSNKFEMTGVITNVSLKPTSIWMTVREEGQHGKTHTVKGFCPEHLKATPDQWTARFAHLESGMQVIVYGSLSMEVERVQNNGSGLMENVRHPLDPNRDLYRPFIWMINVLAIFNPMIHMKRPQAGQAQHAAPQSSSRPVAPPPTSRAPAPRREEDPLPSMPNFGEEPMAWNR